MNPHAQAAAAPVGIGLVMSVRKFVLEAHAIKELVALGTLTAGGPPRGSVCVCTVSPLGHAQTGP